ncbi:MAG TPA: S8 family serine peptidase [Caldilineaceae bacterium]|nr:S8 family serine peptidase [Caldilineaceae bacterium]
MKQVTQQQQQTPEQDRLTFECPLWYWLAIAVTMLFMAFFQQGKAYAASAAVAVDEPVTTTTVQPNDPAFRAGSQYGLRITNMAKAWEYTVGDPQITVALIDTGIDYNHPELADHIHPDGRAFFLNGPSIDEDGHGTLTAGVIAATMHNSTGIAGIAPNVQILPIKVSPGYVQAVANDRNELTVDHMGTVDYNFQDPIRYAADPARGGTKVININFATSIEDPNEEEAIKEALDQGVVVVAAAGNSGNNVPLYPAAYDCVLGVGAVNGEERRAGFSTYGLGIDVVAPGVGILSTTLSNVNGGYMYAHGTSFASPHVSGLAALIFSARPDLTAWDVREIIMRSAKDLGVPGFDAEYGYGLIDGGAALALATQWQAGSGRVLTRCTGERYRVYGSLYFDANHNGLRDEHELAFHEPFTNTTTFVELYGNNGARLLDRTFPNHSGIFTFDVQYDPDEAPYVIKLQNSTLSHPLYFAADFSGPNDIDMLTLAAQTVTVRGTFFVDADGSGLQSRAEDAYQYWGERPAQVALYSDAQGQPLAIATGNEAGDFTFYLAVPTTTVTYTLRSVVQPEIPQLTRDYSLVLTPDGAREVALVVGIDVNTVPVEGQDTTVNSRPVALAAMVAQQRVTLQWQSPMPLRSDSIFAVVYARQPSGPYQTIATTATGAMHSYTLYDLRDGTYYFAVRAVTRDGSHPGLWSDYSDEVQVTVDDGRTEIFLPIVQK